MGNRRHSQPGLRYCFKDQRFVGPLNFKLVCKKCINLFFLHLMQKHAKIISPLFYLSFLSFPLCATSSSWLMYFSVFHLFIVDSFAAPCSIRIETL